MSQNSRSARTLVAVLSASLLLLGSACASGDDSKPDNASGSDAAPDKSGAGASGDASGEVEVLARGAEPRQELRLQFKQGDSFRAVMTMKIGITMIIDGQTLPATNVPAMKMTMPVRIEKVDGTKASFSYSLESVEAVGGPGVDPAVLKQVQTSLDGMKGLSGSGTIDDRGNSSDSKVDTSKVSDPTIKSQLDSLTSQISNLTHPFPNEAVGVGAKWTATRRALLNGLDTNMVATYTLRSRAGNAYELDIEQVMSVPPGPAAVPGLPAGTSVEIVSYDVTNKGASSSDLKRLLPTKATMAGGGDVKMRVRQGTQTQEMLQHLTMDLSLTSA